MSSTTKSKAFSSQPTARPVSLRKQQGLFYQTRKILRRPQFWFGLAVLGPGITWYAIFAFYPVLRSFTMAFTNYNFLDESQTRFVGFENFITVAQNALFPIATKNTLVYAAELWLFTFPTAFAIALALVNINRGRNVFQFIIFIPVVVSLVAISLLFKQIFDPDTGAVNALLRAVHLPEGTWLTHPKTALVTVALVDSWKILGSYMVLLTAGLLNIPPEFYDAAKVDGANGWQTFIHITVPLLAHVLVLIMTMLLIAGLQVFVSATLLPPQPGGPAYATTVLSIWLFNEAFNSWRFGFASAITIVLFLIVFIVTLVQLRLRPNWEY
ncbi:MAG: sugar ABC transporter permease [Caldilineaceae bacterium]